MLVTKKNCKVCQIIKTDKKLLKRIFNSRFYVPGSEDGLLKITEDYKQETIKKGGTVNDYFSVGALQNHCKKHQFIDRKHFDRAMERQINHKLEKQAGRKIIKAQDAVQTVIDRGMERLENGEIDVHTKDLLRASQIKIASEDKQKDRELAMLEMVAHYLSGESDLSKIHDTNRKVIDV